MEQLSSLEERETQLLKETGAVHDLSEQLEQRDIEISALRLVNRP